jgi:hypothetical protein
LRNKNLIKLDYTKTKLIFHSILPFSLSRSFFTTKMENYKNLLEPFLHPQKFHFYLCWISENFLFWTMNFSLHFLLGFQTESSTCFMELSRRKKAVKCSDFGSFHSFIIHELIMEKAFKINGSSCLSYKSDCFLKLISRIFPFKEIIKNFRSHKEKYLSRIFHFFPTITQQILQGCFCTWKFFGFLNIF